jgi:hypothetical protein
LPNYDFRSLSPTEFEELVRDVAQEELRLTLESFARGRDGGIDLRYARDKSSTLIVQCKHLADTGFAGLLSQLKNKEAPKVARLAPTRYVLATSVPLTPANKDAIVAAIGPNFLVPADVWGKDDLNNLLGKYSRIETNHHKLWLTSAAVLDQVLHSGIYTGSKATLDRIQQRTRLYVPNRSFADAQIILKEQHVCIVAGLPGIGKTMLAEMLLVEYHVQGNYQVIAVSSDIKDAFEVFNPEQPQIFYYDDFLGQSSLADKLRKNEDDDLLKFIELVSRNKNKRFVLTTREYILAHARSVYEKLDRSNIDLHKLVIDLQAYSRYDRAKILYNHVYFSGLKPEIRRSFLEERRYIKIIDHKNYNPRLIEGITELAGRENRTDSEFGDFVIFTLDHPNELWNHVFNNQISQLARCILLALASLPTETDLDGAIEASRRLASELSIHTTPFDFKTQMRILDRTFVKIDTDGHLRLIAFHNPSIRDFLIDQLESDTEFLKAVLSSASSFEQCRFLWSRSGLAGSKIHALRSKTEQSQLFLKAIQRTFNARPVEIVMRRNRQGFESRWPATDPIEDRLSFAVTVAEVLHDPSFNAVIHDELLRIIDRWRNGEGSTPAATRLIATVKTAACVDASLKEKASEAAKNYVLSVLDQDLDTFEQALAFFDDNDLTPSPGESTQLRQAFQEHVGGITESFADDVTDSSTMKEDKRRLEDVAKRLEFDASDQVYSLEAAIDEVEEQEERRSEDRYDDDHEWGSDDDRVVTDDDIDTMFDSLDDD